MSYISYFYEGFPVDGGVDGGSGSGSPAKLSMKQRSPSSVHVYS